MASGSWESSAPLALPGRPTPTGGTVLRGRWSRDPGTGSGEGLPRGPELLCEDPSGQAPIESCGVFLRVMVAGRDPGAWTESSLPLLSPSHQTVLLSAQCLQGPDPLNGILTLWSLSPQCVSCTKSSNPNTAHNVEGDGGTIWVCQSCECEQKSPHPTPWGQRGSTHCILGDLQMPKRLLNQPLQ